MKTEIPKTFNARFEKEVMFAIADLIDAKYGRDKTEAVGRAILEAQKRVESGDFAPVVTIGSFAPSVPRILPTASQAAADAPFHPLCKHCGENFGAFNRMASLCPDCKRNRHIGEPRDCPTCTAGNSI